MQVVAGIIDTDGTYNSRKNFFEITQRHDRKHILEDIKFMCESNGLKCSLSSRLSTGKKRGVIHYRLRISGDLSLIPTKILRKKGRKKDTYKSRNKIVRRGTKKTTTTPTKPANENTTNTETSNTTTNEPTTPETTENNTTE